MLRPYAQFPDETVIAYSDIREDQTVEIAIERPRDWGFDSARCLMPTILALGRYVLFFWLGESDEPVHIHVAIRRPTEHAT